MDVRVVCISRAIGAGGEDIGKIVAERLGFIYADEQVIELAARQAQIDPEVVAAAEHRQSFFDRLMDMLPSGLDVAGAMAGAPTAPLDPIESFRATPEEMRMLIRGAIHTLAKAGRVVIVAHAASFALAREEGVLRVLVTAPDAVRALRVAKLKGIEAGEAEREVATSDRERREYLARFYGVKEELPTYYDLVINTEVLTGEQAAAIVLGAPGIG